MCERQLGDSVPPKLTGKDLEQAKHSLIKKKQFMPSNDHINSNQAGKGRGAPLYPPSLCGTAVYKVVLKCCLFHTGQFGKVFKASLKQGMESILVAVKTTKITSSETEKASFMREMTIMSEMMHPNIVRLYGLVQDGEINYLS